MVLAWVKYIPGHSSGVNVARDHSQQAFWEEKRIRRMDVGHLVPAGLDVKAHLTFYRQ